MTKEEAFERLKLKDIDTGNKFMEVVTKLRKAGCWWCQDPHYVLDKCPGAYISIGDCGQMIMRSPECNLAENRGLLMAEDVLGMEIDGDEEDNDGKKSGWIWIQPDPEHTVKIKAPESTVLPPLPDEIPAGGSIDVWNPIDIPPAPESLLPPPPPVSIKNDRKDGKLMWELLPLEDIEDIVAVYTAGAVKYGADQWQNLPDGYRRYKAAMLRHLVEFEKGNWTDPDTGCIHLAQVAWNAIAILHVAKAEQAEKVKRDIEELVNNARKQKEGHEQSN